ncbi:MAG TPA: transglycosylase domain-containing protein [Bauldia sp.]|nr:transglycosylase domain-containing protein [Bauldia sp.]
MSRAASAKSQPAAEAKAARKKDAAGRAAPVRIRRILRAALLVLAGLALIPGVLVPVYMAVPPISTLMIATRIIDGPIERDWVSLDEVAKILVVSVMVAEDGRFCAHRGVDWGALNEVLEDPDGPSRGASTIAMQTVRNLFLWQAPSYFRKGIEIPLALYADAIWTKRRTMEIYLNIAEWGPNIFGIEAAARHHFGKSAKDLTANQAALLAVTLPNPRVRDPANPSRLMRSLARTVAARARVAGDYVKCLYP